MKPTISVLIVDDHALVREGVASILHTADDIRVIGEASDGLEAIDKVKRLNPGIVLMDIAMPRLGGLEATLEIKKVAPGVRVVVLTQYDDKEYVSRFLKAGALGFVLKQALGRELLDAIRCVAKGEVYLYPSIAKDVVEGFLGKVKPAESPYELLTDREKQVLKLLAEGHTHKEVAKLLGISIKTVITHQTHLQEKLGLSSRAEIVRFAIQHKIIRIDSP
jgi:two-component system response regulator NreC